MQWIVKELDAGKLNDSETISDFAILKPLVTWIGNFVSNVCFISIESPHIDVGFSADSLAKFDVSYDLFWECFFKIHFLSQLDCKNE